MANEPVTLSVLAAFHREVILPDMRRVVGELRDEMSGRFDDVDGHFNAIYKRFDRLETEYQMLVAGLRRVEERLDALVTTQQKFALRSELQELKSRVDILQQQIQAIEERLES